MKKFLFTISLFLITGYLTFGQSADQLVSKCLVNAGAEAKYLKDFRIQLGKSTEESGLRFKANISLWKDMKYRFTMCCQEDSQGQLILDIKDESNNVVLSSFDKKSGKAYASVDFICRKSGIYQINYDFSNNEKGSGVGVISVIK